MYAITESERWAAINAFQTAASTVDQHAATMRQMAAALRAGETHAMFAPGEDGAVACDRLAESHEAAAAEYRRLAAAVQVWDTVLCLSEAEAVAGREMYEF